MRKIPTLFRRDPDNRARLLPEVTPGCEWVLAGEGVPTQKYDGTCVMWDGERWWSRREVKKDRMMPPGYVAVETDPVTGKTVGWEPIEQSSFHKAFKEAVEPLRQLSLMLRTELPPGTFELVGPKINGNPEKAEVHRLESHSNADRWDLSGVGYVNRKPEIALERLGAFLALGYRQDGMEGLVWHHPDGRMAKLKARDFPAEPLTCELCPGESFGYHESVRTR